MHADRIARDALAEALRAIDEAWGNTVPSFADAHTPEEMAAAILEALPDGWAFLRERERVLALLSLSDADPDHAPGPGLLSDRRALFLSGWHERGDAIREALAIADRAKGLDR